jgi:hypothetical protein
MEGPFLAAVGTLRDAEVARGRDDGRGWFPGQPACLGTDDQVAGGVREGVVQRAGADRLVDAHRAAVLGRVVGAEFPEHRGVMRHEPLVDPIVVLPLPSGSGLVQVDGLDPVRVVRRIVSVAAAEHDDVGHDLGAAECQGVTREADRAGQVGFGGDGPAGPRVAGVHRVPGGDQDRHSAGPERADRPPDAVVVQTLGDRLRGGRVVDRHIAERHVADDGVHAVRGQRGVLDPLVDDPR